MPTESPSRKRGVGDATGADGTPSRSDLLRSLYHGLWRVRHFEDSVARLNKQGKIMGGVYSGRGQEAIVVGACHAKDVFQIAQELEELARKARENSLLPQDVQGGTFTITNPGVFGAILSTPIIVQPQSAILGVEAIQKMAVVREDDSIAIRSMMNLCLSYDHRVIDGETAIKFLQHIRRTLEEFRFAR